MPQATSKLTDRAWADVFAVNLSRAKERFPVGDGWKTQAEVARLKGWSRQKAQRYLLACVRAGHLERFNGQAISAEGIARRQVWYRPLSKGVRK